MLGRFFKTNKKVFISQRGFCQIFRPIRNIKIKSDDNIQLTTKWTDEIDLKEVKYDTVDYIEENNSLTLSTEQPIDIKIPEQINVDIISNKDVNINNKLEGNIKISSNDINLEKVRGEEISLISKNKIEISKTLECKALHSSSSEFYAKKIMGGLITINSLFMVNIGSIYGSELNISSKDKISISSLDGSCKLDNEKDISLCFNELNEKQNFIKTTNGNVFLDIPDNYNIIINATVKDIKCDDETIFINRTDNKKYQIISKQTINSLKNTKQTGKINVNFNSDFNELNSDSQQFHEINISAENGILNLKKLSWRDRTLKNLSVEN